MNILPHKSWHVRTKANIARVRKDEAEAAEKEKERIKRLKLAEQEARTSLLREKASKLNKTNVKLKEEAPKEDCSVGDKLEHVNFFKELEDGIVSFTGSNKEYEKEKKEEKEKYEKQIGYLTYLGQDTVESTGKISWYNKVPDRLSMNESKTEISVEKKNLIDPLNNIRPYLNSLSKSLPALKKIDFAAKNLKRKRETDNSSSDDNLKIRKKCKKEKKKKKFKKHSSKKRLGSNDSKQKITRKHKKSRYLKGSDDSQESEGDYSSISEDETLKNKKSLIEKLRTQRLQREAEEKLRAKKHLAILRGESLPEEKKQTGPIIKQKYNSQFNPHLAKQNFSEND